MSAPGNVRRSTTKDDWGTPSDIMAALRREFDFTLDVCAEEHNRKAERWLEGPCVKRESDICGLSLQRCNDSGEGSCVNFDECIVAGHWRECGCGLCADWMEHVCFLNPPYSSIDEWISKAASASYRGATVVALLPGSFGNSWYGRAAATCSEERQLRQRVQFIHPPDCECKACAAGTKGSNATDSSVFIWRPSNGTWLTRSRSIGLWSWRD